MKRIHPLTRWAVALSLVWFTLNLLLLHRFPTVYIDEAENANHAYNLAFHHQALFSLYDDFYPPAFSEFRHTWPVVIRPFFCYPLATLIKIIGFSLAKARLFSLMAGLLTLWAVYAAGGLLKNRRLGLFAMAILGTRFMFLYTADRIRPEMLLCLCGVLVFIAFLYNLKTSNPWFAVAAGFLSGVSAGIHTNGIALGIGVILLLMLEKKFVMGGYAVLGGAVGACVFVFTADWTPFLQGLPVLLFREFTSPPILNFRGNILTAIATETGRYFSAWDFNDWRGGWMYHMVNGWQYALCGTALAVGCVRKDALKWPARFGALLALAYALLVSQKALPYVSVLEPYFALAVAAWLSSKPLPSLKETAACLALIVAALPLGKIPAIFIASIAILPKKVFQWALLIALTSFLMRAPDFRVWLTTLLSDLQKLWPLVGAGSALFLAIYMVRRGPRVRLSYAGFGWAALAMTTLATGLFAGGIAAYEPTFNAICREFSQQMVPGKRVVGPQAFWLGLSSYDYRDIGGINWYRLLTGERDLTRPLKEYKPDYIILDSSISRQIAQRNLERGARGLQEPTRLFSWPHRVLEVIDGGPVHGTLALIENAWPPQKNP